MPQSKSNILCLMGPTASGKSALSMKIAKQHACEIINVDSAMVYRGMDIGTAKPSLQEREQVPHWLVDICDARQAYSAGQFVTDATHAIEAILAKGKTPLLVGGTMLYFKALQQGLAELPQAAPTIRVKLEREAQKIGWPDMHKRLAKIDPQSAARIKSTDPQRISRALEVYELTGETLTNFFDRQQANSTVRKYHFTNLALQVDRAELHRRIAQRFDQMLAQGLVAEVEGFFNHDDITADLPSMRSVGYRQVWQYLSGELDKAAMRERAIIATRQLAKRQLTWLRAWPDVLWFSTTTDQVDVLKLLVDRKPTKAPHASNKAANGPPNNV